MFDVIAIGELLIDFSQNSTDGDGYPTLSAHPGGAPANYLAALSKFGKKTALVAKVGNDAFGKLLIGTLKSANINSENVVITSNCFTTLAFVTNDAFGDRSFSFARKPGADTLLSADEIDFSIIDNTKVVHFGTVGMTAEPSNSAHKAVIEAAKSKGKLISFDPNLREPLWDNLDRAKEAMAWGLGIADIVKISDNEAEFLFRLSPKAAAKHILSHFPVKLVMVTLGKKGALFANKNAIGQVENYTDGINTVDTTGAGDIFGGSAMYKILEYNLSPDELNYEQLCDVCSFACKSASLSTTKFGGINSVPDISEI